MGQSRAADQDVADERHVTHCGSSGSHLNSSGLFCFAVSYFHIFHTGESALSCVIHYVMPPPDASQSETKECSYQLCLECLSLETQANVRDAEWAGLASIPFFSSRSTDPQVWKGLRIVHKQNHIRNPHARAPGRAKRRIGRPTDRPPLHRKEPGQNDQNVRAMRGGQVARTRRSPRGSPGIRIRPGSRPATAPSACRTKNCTGMKQVQGIRHELGGPVM